MKIQCRLFLFLHFGVLGSHRYELKDIRPCEMWRFKTNVMCFRSQSHIISTSWAFCFFCSTRRVIVAVIKLTNTTIICDELWACGFSALEMRLAYGQVFSWFQKPCLPPLRVSGTKYFRMKFVMHDALHNCVHCFTFCGEPGNAETYARKLYAPLWFRDGVGQYECTTNLVAPCLSSPTRSTPRILAEVKIHLFDVRLLLKFDICPKCPLLFDYMDHQRSNGARPETRDCTRPACTLKWSFIKWRQKRSPNDQVSEVTNLFIYYSCACARSWSVFVQNTSWSIFEECFLKELQPILPGFRIVVTFQVVSEVRECCVSECSALARI